METLQQTLPLDAFREITLTIRNNKRTYWVFTCCVRIRQYGKVRFAIIYDNPERKGEPIYVFTKMLVWNAKKILSVRLHRWDIEPFHEQIKQFLGAESSQLQNEEGVRKHLTLVFVVNSIRRFVVGELTAAFLGFVFSYLRFVNAMAFGRNTYVWTAMSQNYLGSIL